MVPPGMTAEITLTVLIACLMLSAFCNNVLSTTEVTCAASAYYVDELQCITLQFIHIICTYSTYDARGQSWGETVAPCRPKITMRPFPRACAGSKIVLSDEERSCLRFLCLVLHVCVCVFRGSTF